MSCILSEQFTSENIAVWQENNLSVFKSLSRSVWESILQFLKVFLKWKLVDIQLQRKLKILNCKYMKHTDQP